MQSQKYGLKAIARHLGISRNTVRKHFDLQTFAPKAQPRHTNLLEYEAYLRKRWQEGEQCAKSLLKEIKAMGYNGSYTVLAGLLTTYPKGPNLRSLPPARKGMSISGRSLSVAHCQPEEKWGEKDKPLLTKLLEKSPVLRQLWELNLEFKSMMERKMGNCLESWYERASQHVCFKSFVQGIRQDFEAFRQAMTSEWSNGQTEGQVNRLKNINGRCTAGPALHCYASASWQEQDNLSPKLTMNQHGPDYPTTLAVSITKYIRLKNLVKHLTIFLPTL